MHQRLIITPSAGGVKINSSSSQLEKQVSSLESNKAEGKLQREVPEGECAKQQETVRCVNEEQPTTRSDAEPSAVNSCYPAKAAARGSPLAEATESSVESGSSCSQLCQEDSSPGTWNAKAIPPRKLPLKRCGNAKLANAGGHERVARGEFVHAQFVPAESHQVRVKFASSKTKAVKIKRRNSEKTLRPGKQAFCVEKARGSHGAASLARRPSYSGDVTGRSCSESSLFPVQVRLPTVPPGPELYRTSANALYSLEATCADTANKKKQRKWQSTVEISAKAHLASLSSSFGPGAPRQPARRAGVLRTVSVRAPNRFGDSESSESDSDGSSSVRQSGTVQASSKPLPPVPKICRIKASKALKKKIRRFQPASLKVMTMV
uniref:Dishevelled binding antagonist of beta catenin 2 n=1 Tax=Buteo japonicus TaxID=224669 RepID=A0A8C0HKH8_9AVES